MRVAASQYVKAGEKMWGYRANPVSGVGATIVRKVVVPHGVENSVIINSNVTQILLPVIPPWQVQLAGFQVSAGVAYISSLAFNPLTDLNSVVTITLSTILTRGQIPIIWQNTLAALYVWNSGEEDIDFEVVLGYSV